VNHGGMGGRHGRTLDPVRPRAGRGNWTERNFAVSRARAAWNAMSDDPTYLALNESIVEGLRKAGVPEQ
jgi:hypothetical protein